MLFLTALFSQRHHTSYLASLPSSPFCSPWPQSHLSNLYLTVSPLSETALPSAPYPMQVSFGECRARVCATPGKGSLQVLSVCLPP